MRAENERLREQVEGLQRQNEQLLRKVLGEMSEKMPPLKRDVKRRDDEAQEAEDGGKGKRKQRRKRRQHMSAKTDSSF